MKKLLFFLCILLNLGCMMLAALLFALRSKGEAALFLGQSIDPTIAIAVLVLLGSLFIILATRMAVTMRRK